MYIYICLDMHIHICKHIYIYICISTHILCIAHMYTQNRYSLLRVERELGKRSQELMCLSLEIRAPCFRAGELRVNGCGSKSMVAHFGVGAPILEPILVGLGCSPGVQGFDPQPNEVLVDS